MEIKFKKFYTLHEGFKEKVQRFSIKSSTMQNFVLKYENLIDWSKVSKENPLVDIRSQIRELNKEFINSKTDISSDNTALSKVDDLNWEKELEALKFNAENGDEEAEQALEIFKNDPDEAKEKVIKSINQSKASIIYGWMNYMGHNDVYAKRPEFIYLVYKSLLDISGKDRNPPNPVNAAIVATIYDKIKNSPKSLFNIKKQYKASYTDYLLEKNKVITTKGGGKWVKIPSKSEDPENYEQNVRDLMNISYSSWCIKQSLYANNYLSKGAFWLYIIEDKKNNKYAEIAIRLEGDRIQEIRGATSSQELLDSHEPIIANFLEKNKEIKGGDIFLETYYRKKNNENFWKDLNENSQKYLEIYERLMPDEYINDDVGLDINKSEKEITKEINLKTWWENKGKFDIDPNQQTFSFSYEDKIIKSINELDDKTKDTALYFGLLYHAGLIGNDFKNDIGYNYYIYNTLDLGEIGKLVGDSRLQEIDDQINNGFDVYVDSIDYGEYEDFFRNSDTENLMGKYYVLNSDDIDLDPTFKEFLNLVSDDDTTIRDSIFSAEYDALTQAHETAINEVIKEDVPEMLVDSDPSIRILLDEKHTYSENELYIEKNNIIKYLLDVDNFEETLNNGELVVDWDVDHISEPDPYHYYDHEDAFNYLRSEGYDTGILLTPEQENEVANNLHIIKLIEDAEDVEKSEISDEGIIDKEWKIIDEFDGGGLELKEKWGNEINPSEIDEFRLFAIPANNPYYYYGKDRYINFYLCKKVDSSVENDQDTP